MRAFVVAASVALLATATMPSTSTDVSSSPVDADRRLAQAGEREGQDPAPEGADMLPGSDEAGERVGQDPDVPGGSAAGTPKVVEPEERVGQDPDVPGGDAPVK